jgi:hypothetical protein
LGQKQTLSDISAMSALPPKADIDERDLDVRFAPKADILRCSEERRCSIASPAATKQHRRHSQPFVGGD